MNSWSREGAGGEVVRASGGESRGTKKISLMRRKKRM